MKKLFLWILALVLCAPVAARAGSLAGTEIAILRIGKADAIIVLSGGHTLLIDAGEEDDADEILEFLRDRRVQAVDAMIITHFDKDHVGGAGGVLRGIPVRAVYDADYPASSDEYHAYVEAMTALGVPRHRVAGETALTFGALTVRLMPTALETDSDNDNSLVLRMEDAYNAFFFAGDAEEARIDELLAAGLMPCALVKMPHHGRWKDNLPGLLDALAPGVAVITDSDKNPADGETLEALAARGIDTYCTKDGDIRVVSGRNGLQVMQ